jgi:hypothetical protein
MARGSKIDRGVVDCRCSTDERRDRIVFDRDKTLGIRVIIGDCMRSTRCSVLVRRIQW